MLTLVAWEKNVFDFRFSPVVTHAGWSLLKLCREHFWYN